MKEISLSFLCILFCCRLAAMDVVISGRISNSPDPHIVVTFPVNGHLFAGAKDTIKMDIQKGDFHIARNLTAPGYISLNNNGSSFYLFITPGKNYSFSVDMKNPATQQIEGAEQEGQLLLNRLSPGHDLRKDLLKTDSSFTNLDDRITEYETRIRRIREEVKQLYARHKIGKAFYAALLNYLDVYRVSLLSYDLFFEYRRKWEQKVGKEASFSAEMKEEREHLLKRWGNLYQHLAAHQQWVDAPGYPALVGKLASYHQVLDKGNLIFPYKVEHQIKEASDFHLKKLAGIMQEYAWADHVYAGILVSKNEKEWIGDFEAFKKQYPQSRLTRYLQPYISQIIAYHQNIESGPEASYLPRYDSIRSFDALTDVLRGKITYVDIWATWCVPCREEMKFVKEVHAELDAIGVQCLYLSIDKEMADQAWKDMLKGLGLTGMHMRASEALYKELISKIPAIPRYLIIGRNGKVLEWEAMRPSNKNDLILQLKKHM